jgi:hypothetical protein
LRRWAELVSYSEESHGIWNENSTFNSAINCPASPFRKSQMFTQERGKQLKISNNNRNCILSNIERAPNNTIQDLYFSLYKFICHITLPKALREAGEKNGRS